jgi:hypothetical protein
MIRSDKSKQSHFSEKIDSREAGLWRSGITNPAMCSLLGEIIGDWVHIEEVMINMMNLVIFPDANERMNVSKKARGFLPGRQIFRAISSNGGRVKIMTALLAHYPGNDKKKLDSRYEDVISEFQSLVNARNDYLHGLWWTKADGNVYLQTENLETTMFNRKRRIPKIDFEQFMKRCLALRQAIDVLELKEYRGSDERKGELATHAAHRSKSQ